VTPATLWKSVGPSPSETHTSVYSWRHTAASPVLAILVMVSSKMTRLDAGGGQMERETRLELATSTLARLRSTN
jgi:hypothetical protein